MSTTNLNAELFRQLSYIADDENYMKKVLNYIKILASQKEKETTADTLAEDDVPYRTKEELIADINEVCNQIKQARAGKLKGRPLEEVLNEL